MTKSIILDCCSWKLRRSSDRAGDVQSEPADGRGGGGSRAGYDSALVSCTEHKQSVEDSVN